MMIATPMLDMQNWRYALLVRVRTNCSHAAKKDDALRSGSNPLADAHDVLYSALSPQADS